MRKNIFATTSLLLLSTQFCHAHALTLAEADGIIVVLVAIVIVLLVMGSVVLRQSRTLKQRNEQLRRILNALDEYRAIVGNGELALDVQEEMVKKKQSASKMKTTKADSMDEKHAFYVKMDARVNKEKPFTDPDFDYYALIEFMGVSRDEFCRLIPRYTDPERTKDYINSLRAEYAAKLLMEHSDDSMENIVSKCGFKDTAAFNSAFKFSFGITPTDYLNTISQMFKNKV
ncbi:MAG: helix-turn-helix domain-containing protein [Bacteroidaceae bacterium]|nr:helix-turn-helix domain-containing protein [Bacteroidaceae bacterium]